MRIDMLDTVIEGRSSVKVDEKLWRDTLKMLQERMVEERRPHELAMIAAQVSIILLLRGILERITDTNNPIEVRLR